MISNRITTVTLRGVTYRMRPGRPVPVAVQAHWRATGQMEQLVKSGTVSDDADVSRASVGGGGKRVTAKPEPVASVAAEKDSDGDQE